MAILELDDVTSRLGASLNEYLNLASGDDPEDDTRLAPAIADTNDIIVGYIQSRYTIAPLETAKPPALLSAGVAILVYLLVTRFRTDAFDDAVSLPYLKAIQWLEAVRDGTQRIVWPEDESSTTEDSTVPVSVVIGSAVPADTPGMPSTASWFPNF